MLGMDSVGRTSPPVLSYSNLKASSLRFVTTDGGFTVSESRKFGYKRVGMFAVIMVSSLGALMKPFVLFKGAAFEFTALSFFGIVCLSVAFIVFLVALLRRWGNYAEFLEVTSNSVLIRKAINISDVQFPFTELADIDCIEGITQTMFLKREVRQFGLRIRRRDKQNYQLFFGHEQAALEEIEREARRLIALRLPPSPMSDAIIPPRPQL